MEFLVEYLITKIFNSYSPRNYTHIVHTSHIVTDEALAPPLSNQLNTANNVPGLSIQNAVKYILDILFQ